MSDNIIEVALRAQTSELSSGMSQASSIVAASTAAMGGQFDALAARSTEDIAKLTSINKSWADSFTQVKTVGVASMQATSTATRQTGDEFLIAAEKAKVLKAEGVATMQEIRVQTQEANHAIHLLGEETGVHMSRALRTVLSHSQTLAPIFASMFSVVAAVGFIEIIVHVGEKLADLISETFIYTEALKEQERETKDMNTQLVAEAKAIQELSDKLRDQGKGAVDLLSGSIDRNAKSLEENRAELKKNIADLAALEKKSKEVTVAYDDMFGQMSEIPAEGAEAAGKALVKLQNEQILLNQRIKEGELNAKFMTKELADTKVKEAQEANAKAVTKMLGDWELSYLKMQQAEGKFSDVSKADELKFWEDKIAIAAKYPNAYKTVLAKVVPLQKAAQADALALFLADQRVKEEAEKTGSKERLDITTATFNYVSQFYKKDSKEYQAALAAMTAAKREFEDKNERDREHDLEQTIKTGIAEIDGVQKNSKEKIGILQDELAFKHKLGQINDADALQAEKAMLRDLYQIDSKALEAKIALLKLDPTRNKVEIEKTNQEIVQLETKLQRDLNKVTDTNVKERMAKYHDAFKKMETEFSSTVTGLITGSETIGQAFQKVAEQMVGVAVGAFSKILFKWIETHVMMKIFGQTSTASEIASAAALASANTFASIAAIPIIGPGMAPAAASASYSAVMAMQGLNAFERGGIVPNDSLALVHKNEMVLPSSLSQSLQSMARAGGGGSGVSVQYAPTVHAIDAKGVGEVLERHSKQLVRVLRNELRAGRA